MTHVVVSAPPKSYDEWNDPLDGWKIPADPIDMAPIVDRPGGNAFTRGHQFMPTLTFSQGKIVVVYYDSRLDHTRTFYAPHQSEDPCAPVGSCWAPNSEGRWYDEERGPVGERTGLDWTTSELDDSLMTQKRHTVDVRMAMADASAAPVFTSAPLSRMPFGERGDELDLHPGGTAPGFNGPIGVVDLDASPKPALRRLQDLQVNPPNLPMFKNGTTAFIGDYIDVQGPMFVRTDTGWSFNTAPTSAPGLPRRLDLEPGRRAASRRRLDEVHATRPGGGHGQRLRSRADAPVRLRSPVHRHAQPEHLHRAGLRRARGQLAPERQDPPRLPGWREQPAVLRGVRVQRHRVREALHVLPGRRSRRRPRLAPPGRGRHCRHREDPGPFLRRADGLHEPPRRHQPCLGEPRHAGGERDRGRRSAQRLRDPEPARPHVRHGHAR